MSSVYLPSNPVLGGFIIYSIVGLLFLLSIIGHTVVMLFGYDIYGLNLCFYIFLLAINIGFGIFFLVINAIYFPELSNLLLTILVFVFVLFALIYIIYFIVVISLAQNKVLRFKNFVVYENDELLKFNVFHNKMEVFWHLCTGYFLITMLTILVFSLFPSWISLVVGICVKLLFSVFISFVLSIEQTPTNVIIYLQIFLFLVSVACESVYSLMYIEYIKFV